MIKVFDKTNEYEAYSLNGINSGELCYVKEDKSAHFRTNNIDGTDKTYDLSEGGGSVSTGTKITIGFRNVGNLYGIRDLNGDNESGVNFYLGNTNLGTVITSSNSPYNMGGGYMYLQDDGQLMSTPDPNFLNESEITWIKLNGVKEHIFEELPQSLEILISFVALSKDGVSAPIFGHTSITLPSDIEGKNCILVYDFVPNTEDNTYFQLNEDNSFIL